MNGLEAVNLAVDCFQTIFEQHHTMMLIINPQDGSIIHANASAVHFYGWSLAELKQKKIWEINTLPQEVVLAKLAKAQSGRCFAFEFGYRRANGGISEVEVCTTPVIWQDHAFICSMVTDVTERNEVAQALRGQNERLQQANDELTRQSQIQAVLREIAEAAISAPSLDYLYQMVHQIVQRILPAENFYIGMRDSATGWIYRPYAVGERNTLDRSRPPGKGRTEYVMRHGQAVRLTAELTAELVRQGEIIQKIQECHEWLGAPLYDPQGSCFGVLAMYSTDKSQGFKPEDSSVLSIIAAQLSQAIQRKRTEDNLSESEERYRAVMEQSPEAVIICDPHTGEIVETNSLFSERFGYDLNQNKPMYVFDLTLDSRENIEGVLERVRREGYLPAERSTIKHRSGARVQVERTATLVRYRDRSLLVQTLRDVTDIVRREQKLQRDAELATRVQNTLLKPVKANAYLDIETIYEPHSYVGGDLYFLDWRYDGNLLRGYLLDAAGHGVATALHTSALHVLLREVNEMDLPLAEQMRWLNRRTSQYFEYEAFAGALCFELDLQTRELRWSSAGIPVLWLQTRCCKGIVTCPGLYLGINSLESFDTHSIRLEEGDSVCFMTDGLSDQLERHSGLPLGFEAMVATLRRMALGANCLDDATAICIRIKSWPESSSFQTGWPRTLRLNGYGDYQRLKHEVGKILAELTGQPHSMLEVAINEALVNAIECRDGVHRNYRASLKLNLVGRRLIARVKTTRIGFAGNALLRRLRANPAEMFSFVEDSGMGRGIPIMLSTADRMMYNSEGTELLLVWKLDS